MMLKSVCPILPSKDFEETRKFYQFLGFDCAFEYPDEGYLILVRDHVELHFFRAPNHEPEKSDHGAFVRVDDANALSKEFKALGLLADGIPRCGIAEDKPWGICELGIFDTDGNLVRMGHILA